MAPALLALLLVAAGAGGWYWFTHHGARTASPAMTAPAQADAQPAPDPNAAAQAPAPTLVPPAAEEVVKADDIPGALTQLLGRDAVLRFLETTDFPRKFVATLDNLGREHAPVTVWPVQPAPGRFVVEAAGGSQVMAAENSLRYTPFVAFAGSIDAARAVELYRRMYPVLEQAYRDLGFANRPLHGRVFEVIDLLLATPEPAQPPKLTLTEVKGPIPSARPWTRYEYDDPSLQRLTAGQKMLLRMGSENRKVLKAKLAELRRQLLQVSTTDATKP